jgi:hypothetical protein
VRGGGRRRGTIDEEGRANDGLIVTEEASSGYGDIRLSESSHDSVLTINSMSTREEIACAGEAGGTE